ncbi:MAG: hypothetical protein A2428_08565 [Bdellovibrionales bacterium RIFOXYC1_FULL_54_43]|nr:MAG: hypothetical protein A2428_08565 [Bdellovibrionales bacterium RIFOXYC1_FULL_54_43]OFZ84270.1 MAG: hypothetical protein A2603_15145 [Bdellovibrionales bacterium RIFOXYD1_FULL_55_31]
MRKVVVFALVSVIAAAATNVFAYDSALEQKYPGWIAAKWNDSRANLLSETKTCRILLGCSSYSNSCDDRGKLYLFAKETLDADDCLKTIRKAIIETDFFGSGCRGSLEQTESEQEFYLRDYRQKYSLAWVWYKVNGSGYVSFNHLTTFICRADESAFWMIPTGNF